MGLKASGENKRSERAALAYGKNRSLSTQKKWPVMGEEARRNLEESSGRREF